jgi:hypothetical protein
MFGFGLSVLLDELSEQGPMQYTFFVDIFLIASRLSTDNLYFRSMRSAGY